MAVFGTRRPLLLLGLAAVLVAASLAAMVFVLRQAFPPRRFVLTTGPEGGAYDEIGRRYREILARKGIQAELRTSSGDTENLARLKDPRSGVSAGFVAGGLTTESESPGVVSLGTISRDPLWMFCRGFTEPSRLDELRGKRISIGPEGSGTRAWVLQLLRVNGLEGAFQPSAFAPQEGAEALLRGEIDCACMLTPADSPAVRKLLDHEGVDLLSFVRADAYVAIFPQLRKVVLPRGVGNLALDRPPQDVTLIAPAASLLIRESLHPAIQFLLLQAAEAVHSGPGILRRAGEFPSAEQVDLPLSSEAEPFYKSGGGFLQRHLPFWLWVFASRMLLVLIPLAGIVYPLASLTPAIVAGVVNLRLNRLYKQLRGIESRIDAGKADPGELALELDRFESQVRRTRVPSPYARSLYTLLQHARLVHDRLARRERT